MNGSILHTSHSGSTLLAYLLSPLAEVYSEPIWTHQMIREKRSPQEIYPTEGIIVKYPSGLCHLAPNIKGSKVFLYRNLGEHLLKIRANVDSTYIDYYYDYFQLYCHPFLKSTTPSTPLEKHAFLWAHRILWSQEKDVTYIKSVDFLSNPKLTLETVCDLFGVKKPDKFVLPAFNVKLAGYYHQDTPLSKVVPQPSPTVEPKEGIIPPSVIENSVMVKEAREWITTNTPIETSFL